MAKISNETTLILKLAEERIKSNSALAKNRVYYKNRTWTPEEAMEFGYNLGVCAYQDTLACIKAGLEMK